MPDEPQASPLDGLTNEDLLAELNKRWAPPPKTYEDGLAEGKQAGYSEGVAKAIEIGSAAVSKATEWAEVHAETPRAKPFNQIASEIGAMVNQLQGGDGEQ